MAKSELAVVEKSAELVAVADNDIALAWGIPTDEWAIFVPRAPFQIRCDCQVGAFKIGDETRIGDTAEIRLVQPPRYFWGYLGKPTNQEGASTHTNWVQLVYVPAPGCKSDMPRNTVCVTYFKTQSLQSFDRALTIARSNYRGDFVKGVFSIKFAPRKRKDGGQYYSAEFEFRVPTHDGSENSKNIAASEVAQWHMGIKPLIQSGQSFTDPDGEKTLICIRDRNTYLEDEIVARMSQVAAQSPEMPLHEIMLAVADKDAQLEDAIDGVDAPF